MQTETDTDNKESVSPATNDAAMFDIFEFRIKGNTLLSHSDIERAVYSFMGEQRTIADVERAQRALEKAYKDHGYLTVFVDIPEQHVSKGVVMLEVTEGTVGRLRVRGSRYYSLGSIRDSVPSLAEGSVPYFPDVQNDIVNLNRSPGRRVEPVLRAGRTPGTVDVDLNVQDTRPLHASLELNDRYGVDTTRLRLIGAVRYDNLWQLDHSLNIQMQTSPEDTSEVNVFSASYVMPTSNDGDALAVYGIRSRSNVATVGDINVIGNGNILGARFMVPLPPREHYFQTASFGVDLKDFKQSLQFGSDHAETPIRYFAFSIQHSGTQASDSGSTQTGLGINFSLRGLSRRTIECIPGDVEDQFECSRHGADGDYAFLRADVQRKQFLPRQWALIFKSSAQLSNRPLVSNEEFSAGGAESVRGYLDSQILGDSGVQGTAELESPRLPGSDVDWRAHIFFDGARVSDHDPLPGSTSTFTIYSTGLGVRTKAWDNFTGDFDIAWPLRDLEGTGEDIHRGEPRLHFRLVAGF